jgi:hypothetical protein
MNDEPSQDLIEVRLRSAAQFAPVRVLEDHYERDEEGRRRLVGGSSVPIRIVMVEAAEELERLRAAVNALPELLAENAKLRERNAPPADDGIVGRDEVLKDVYDWLTSYAANHYTFKKGLYERYEIESEFLTETADDMIEDLAGEPLKQKWRDVQSWHTRIAEIRKECAEQVARLSAELAAERARRAEVEKVAIDVGASLAAAISLLERGGERAAPSRKMFNVMLTDYKKSLARARAYFNSPATLTKDTP